MATIINIGMIDIRECSNEHTVHLFITALTASNINHVVLITENTIDPAYTKIKSTLEKQNKEIDTDVRASNPEDVTHHYRSKNHENAETQYQFYYFGISVIDGPKKGSDIKYVYVQPEFGESYYKNATQHESLLFFNKHDKNNAQPDSKPSEKPPQKTR